MAFLFGGIRTEMRTRTNAIIKGMKTLERAFNKNTRLFNPSSIPPAIRKDLKTNFENLLAQERSLAEAIDKHIEMLEDLSRKL